MVINILLIAVAYLLGSIPSAVWVGKRFYGIDVREHGSKNAGATNTLRVLGNRAALVVFAMDIAKGFAAVMLWHLSCAEGEGISAMKIALAAAAVLGHVYPIFAGFKGGKGVATIAGAVLGIFPAAVGLCIVTFIIIFVATHYVSLGSMIAGLLFPVYEIFLFGERSVSLIIFCCAVSVMLIYTHRKNISRLLNGTESKTYLSAVKRALYEEEKKSGK